MDKTTNPEVELDNTTTTETQTVQNEGQERDEVSALKARIAILERHSKKAGQTLDKDTLDKVEKLAHKQTISEFAEENGLNMTQARELFEVKPDIKKEDLNRPAFKAIVDTFKRQERVANNTPGTNIGASEQSDFWKLSREERIKSFEKTFKG